MAVSDAGVNSFGRILVVSPTWVGDMVLATPSFRAIRDRYDGARITALCGRNVVPIVEGGGWFDDWICWPDRRRNAFEVIRLAARLRQAAFPDLLFWPCYYPQLQSGLGFSIDKIVLIGFFTLVLA